MDDYEVSAVAKILSEWNPLGDDAGRVNDLDGYKTESADILFELEMRSMSSARVKKVVMQLLASQPLARAAQRVIQYTLLQP